MVATQRAEPKPKTVPIIFNGQQVKVEIPILGSALRDLGHIPADNQLFEERPGPEPDVLIDPVASYRPKPGTHYYDLPRGTVGIAARPEQLAFATKQLPDGEYEEASDGSALMRWTAQLPDGWSPGVASLVVVVPPVYPQQAPAGFDAVGPIAKAGDVLAGAGSNTVAGGATTHFCWNPAGAIDYAARDGLWRFAKFAEQRFRQ